MSVDVSEQAGFSKLLVANRGEIACRIIRTARRLGIATVAIYSDADSDALHVRLADESVFIGASKAAESYLNIDKVISAAKFTNASAIHPGYGFLSENPEFAKHCESKKITLVGPSADSIEKMGIKDTAKSIAKLCKLPVIDGYEGDNQDQQYLLQQAQQIGFPVMIKAVAGGGGKGLKIADDEQSFFLQLDSAKREAGASFGNEKMILEKYLEAPRHIEIQIFADKHGNVVSLFERDCSIQRRHQKILEEAPAPNFSPQLRTAMGEAACKLAQFISYEGAGTVEFLVDKQGQYFFLEMNTRLQVEHGITEAITGLDLVEWQLLVAAGAELPLRQQQIKMQGHAIEARLCAENPAEDFLPSTGTIEYMKLPDTAAGARFDMAVEQGDCVSPYYDSLLGKAIVWGADRKDAVNKIQETLASTLIAGIDTNVNYLQRLVNSDHYQQAEINTDFISNFAGDDEKLIAEGAHWAAAAVAHAQADHGTEFNNGWRLNSANQLRIGLSHRQFSQQLYLSDSAPNIDGQGWRVMVAGQPYIAELTAASPDRISISRGGNDEDKTTEFDIIRLPGLQPGTRSDRIICFEGNKPFFFELNDQISEYTTTLIGASGCSDSLYSAPMNGIISAILVAPATKVEANTVLMVVEAMKMEFPILSQTRGTVSDFCFAVGDSVEQGQTLLHLEELAMTTDKLADF